MLFGIREICDVVLRAKSAQKIGNKVFYKNEPVLYFDSLKTSSLEGQATTVYAQGGRGNVRLIAWEGERTVTFVMEDALISPEGISILTGAGLIQATEEKPIIIHKTEVTKINSIMGSPSNNQIFGCSIKLKDIPYTGEDNIQRNQEDFIYVMLLDDNGEVISEPYIATEAENPSNIIQIYKTETSTYKSDNFDNLGNYRKNDLKSFKVDQPVLVDYYVKKKNDAIQINITPENFSGNFYLEASTLFRATNGVDMPAEFIIPNCKIQSNFTFTMAPSGDPTTFTFTMDAFPDYTRWNKTEKVFATIQVIDQNEVTSDFERLGTPHNYRSDEDYNPFLTYKKEQEQYITEEPEELLNDIFTSVDGDGDIYEGVGYKKNAILTSNQETQGYTITGSIPCKAGQVINITGFNKEVNNNTHQGIFFYDGAGSYGNLIGQPYIPPENSNNISYDTGANEDLGPDSSLKYIRVCFYNTKLSEMAILVSGNPISSEEGSGGRSIPNSEPEEEDTEPTRNESQDDIESEEEVVEPATADNGDER